MKKAYKLKVADAVSKTLDICREFYNAARETRCLQATKSISYQDQAQQLPAIKKSRAIERRTFSTESSFRYQACCFNVDLSSPLFSKRGGYQ
ncbi:MAG: hypothetical protein JNN15_03575 [Blastocatellia bacterium]|nr:hypothetical protein [Blastocatellia bacterium]